MVGPVLVTDMRNSALFGDQQLKAQMRIRGSTPVIFNRVAGDSKVTGGVYSYLQQFTKVKVIRRHLAHSVLRGWLQIVCYASRDWDHG